MFSLEHTYRDVFQRTFLRIAIGNASNSSSVVPNPVISFIFLRNRPRPIGKLRADSGRSKDPAYRVRGESRGES